MEVGGHKRVVISGYHNIHHLLVKKADFTSDRVLASMPARLAKLNEQSPGQ